VDGEGGVGGGDGSVLHTTSISVPVTTPLVRRQRQCLGCYWGAAASQHAVLSKYALVPLVATPIAVYERIAAAVPQAIVVAPDELEENDEPINENDDADDDDDDEADADNADGKSAKKPRKQAMGASSSGNSASKTGPAKNALPEALLPGWSDDSQPLLVK
jgi:hypothetical protein